MPNIRYVSKNLFIEKLSISNIAKKTGTPCYIYSENQIKENYTKFVNTFKKINPLICFAAKSNSNLSVLRSLGKLGAGTDVVSAGELIKALKAGIKANKIVFSGVGKTEEELKIAINKKILFLGSIFTLIIFNNSFNIIKFRRIMYITRYRYSYTIRFKRTYPMF